MEKLEKLQNSYEAVQNNLPPFLEVHKLFGLHSCEEDLPILDEVRLRIHDTFEVFAKVMESSLQPESHFLELYESHAFNEIERKELYALYKRIMFVVRGSLAAATENTDYARAEFIKVSVGTYKEIKPQLIEFTSKLRDAWTHENVMNDHPGYLG